MRSEDRILCCTFLSDLVRVGAVDVFAFRHKELFREVAVASCAVDFCPTAADEGDFKIVPEVGVSHADAAVDVNGNFGAIRHWKSPWLM